ncbi:superfamily II DNA helicase [Rivularia sp. PCC 7116]|uniref:DEAD/DEAH box helicase n=1 Tax=Rivularia sp. PCC 7116 TaxID=373994 RepID=UPI00029EED4A|nr:DEAD/DEAH box helicase [Rivularia sp. PCC 7116]AFY53873.1 superfamily II DNA helicase [Rivularia sp. PCC 7116]
MSELLLWQLAYHLSGSTLLGITEQEPLGTLPIPIRTAVLKTVKQFNPDSIDLRLNKKSPLDFGEGEYEWVESWNYKNSSQLDPNLEKLLHKLPQRYPTYQKVALKLLRQAVENGKSHLVLADFQPTIASFALAILDLIAVVEQVSQLYGLSIALPKVEIYLVGSVDIGVTELLKNYRGVDLNETSNFIDSPQTSVKLVRNEQLPEDVDFISVAESLNNNPHKNSHSFNDLERLGLEFVDCVRDVPPLQAHPVSFERPTLDYFARRYFPLPELKLEQVELIQKALDNQSILGLLPTGFGKSLIFQLYALLIPRTTLVISPLKALIRDQVNNLKRTGLNCVESIISGETAKQRKTKLEGLKFARYRMLYVSPERLQIGEFYDELKAIMHQNPIGGLVIDEAHCVSEWGHDFRPAYLQIGRLQQTLETASGSKVPIIALTATASEPVRKDILRILGLSQESIVQSPNSDRPNFSLSVHRVSQPKDKMILLKGLLQKIVPNVLNIPFEELIPENNDPKYAGIIFSIYADPHGKSTLHEGVHYIADNVAKQVVPEASLVRVYASRQPEYCPSCNSSFFINKSKNAFCLSCGDSFGLRQGKKAKNWDKFLQECQDAFQSDKFPLLVATNGYGMGIDKRNIRFIIHHGFSSSLEAYYQEAGRAGRDGQHSHIALMYIPPDKKCKQEYLDKKLEPPCVAINYRRYDCPYYEDYLCDYGHQAIFIRKSYEGIEKDINSVFTVYEKLKSGETVKFTSNSDKKEEIYLYRLQQLGIVKQYYKHYNKGFRGEYKVIFDDNWDWQQLANYLKQFLVDTGFDDKKAKDEIEKIHKKVSYSSQNIKIILLKEALKSLLERVYERIFRMRYQMLSNQLDYAESDKEEVCRRVFLRGIFDLDKHLATENYRCGFCDSCVPNLNFENSKAAVLMEEAQVEDLIEKLPNVLEQFDRDNLFEILNLTIEKGAIAGLFARVANRLERDPSNLPALYLAGALGRLRKGKEIIAFEYLKFGFKEGIKQGLSPDNLLIFYQEAVLLNPEEAFSWLTEVGGYWDNQAGLQFLIEEANQRFGIDSTQYRILILLLQVRKLNKVSDDSINLKPGIKKLKQGFERLN